MNAVFPRVLAATLRTCYAVLVCLMIPAASHALCAASSGYPDIRCDGTVRVAVIGDSLVAGFGDTTNSNRGGYVLRTAKTLPQFSFTNLGKLGLKTAPLFRDLSVKLAVGQENSRKDAIFNADIVILDLGRNDRWLFGTPFETFQRLKRTAKLITKRAVENGVTPPLIVTAVLMLPNRGSQGPWVKELNKLILKSTTLQYPSDLRFDLVSKRLLSADQIHPTPAGYKALAAKLREYLVDVLPARIRKLYHNQ